MKFDSLDFYQEHALRYSQLSHEFTHSVYTGSSHPGVKNDLDLLRRVVELAPGRWCLDAGCGAGARDVHILHSWGCEAYGVDAVEENISLAKELHPEIAGRLQVADLREPLPFEDDSFDFIICNSVIQHLPPASTEHTVLPALIRGLTQGGVLQLIFKVGSGVVTVIDRAYGPESTPRAFQLYSEHWLLEVLERNGCTLIEAEANEKLGGFIYFDDFKPMRHCAFWARKGT